MIQDLTTGDSGRVLLGYTVPMFISVAFQQIYNIADSMIAGRFAGEDALAAVGASYPITMIFMAVAVGCNIGCSVIISQLFGAKRYRELKTAVSTVMLVGFVLSALLTAVGLVTTAPMMRAIRTPGNIFADGALYLRIYIGGFVFLFLYNVVTGMFNSLGDSPRTAWKLPTRPPWSTSSLPKRRPCLPKRRPCWVTDWARKYSRESKPRSVGACSSPTATKPSGGNRAGITGRPCAAATWESP